MKNIQFTIPGDPIAKGRARSVTRPKRGGGTYIAHITPEKTVNYENLVKFTAAQAMKDEKPTEKPVELKIRAYLGVASSWSIKRRGEAVRGLEMPTKKPDLDNIIKSVKDGMNKVVWNDDAQVVALTASKHYSERPRVEVEISEFKIDV